MVAAISQGRQSIVTHKVCLRHYTRKYGAPLCPFGVQAGGGGQRTRFTLPWCLPSLTAIRVRRGQHDPPPSRRRRSRDVNSLELPVPGIRTGTVQAPVHPPARGAR